MITGRNYPIIRMKLMQSRTYSTPKYPIFDFSSGGEQRQKIGAISFASIGLHKGYRLFQDSAIIAERQRHKFRDRWMRICLLDTVIDSKFQLPCIQFPIDG